MVVSYYNFIQKKGDMQAEICAINSFGAEVSYRIKNYEELLNQNKYKNYNPPDPASGYLSAYYN